jgi:hypothetical protein
MHSFETCVVDLMLQIQGLRQTLEELQRRVELLGGDARPLVRTEADTPLGLIPVEAVRGWLVQFLGLSPVPHPQGRRRNVAGPLLGRVSRTVCQG